MVRVLVVLLIVLLIALPGSVLAFEWHYAERIYPGVSVWDVDVGGMRPDEAAPALVSDLGIDSPVIKLYGPDKSWSVRPTDVGLQLDPWATLVQVYYTGRDRSASISDRLLTHAQLMVYGEEFSPVVMYDEQVARHYLEVLAEQVDLPAVDAVLSLDGLTPVAQPAQEGRYLDVEATLAALSPAVLRMASAEVELVVHPITPTITDAETARAEAETLLDGPLTLLLDRPFEGDPGPWVISPEELAAVMVVQVEGSELRARLNEAPIRDYLEALTHTLAIEPVDARYHFNDTLGQLEPISSSVEGRALDVDASLARIVEGLTAGGRYISLATQSVPPRYPDTATAEELGIVELVAEGDSYFIGSPSGRDRNIRLATSKFDGIVIDPGETFSFNHYLGEVSAEAGYDESYITAGEELAIEVGGGICQVSTTAFRAAFWGGYPIVERWYHNHRVGYYELMGAGLGMDATVYSPVVDFKFTNDRPYPLLIETEIEEGSHRLVFRFYSTGDGRRVEREGPEISDRVTPGPPIYQLDEKLASGTVIQWQSAVNGLTATVGRRVLDAEGGLLYDDVFVSKYGARRASYHYGPGYQPPPEQGEEPTDSP
jgi:vancomycin resistance protein YoaR